MSVRKLEELTQSNQQFARTHQIKPKRQERNEYHYIEEELCEQLGTKVKVTSNKIEISFVNSNDLNRILEIINIKPGR